MESHIQQTFEDYVHFISADGRRGNSVRWSWRFLQICTRRPLCRCVQQV